MTYDKTVLKNTTLYNSVKDRYSQESSEYKKARRLLKGFWRVVTHNKDTTGENTHEIRFNDYQVSKIIGEKYNIPYSNYGVYTNDFDKFFDIVYKNRHEIDIKLSVNPIRPVYDYNKGKYVYGGKMENIRAISNIMLDVDTYGKPLLDDALTMIFKNFGVDVHTYVTVHSGNGAHVIIPLDIILIPDMPLPDDDYDIRKEYDKYRLLLKKGYGAKFINRKNFRKEDMIKNFGCFIDEQSFVLTKHCSIPLTFNMKKEKKKRAILKYHTKITPENLMNTELTEAVFSFIDKIKVYNKKVNVDVKNLPIDGEKKDYKDDEIYQSPLVKLLLSRTLPEGGRNNYLIFPLKILLKQNGYDFNSSVVQRLKRDICSVQKERFAFNEPTIANGFSVNPVNRYCIMNMLPLVYDFSDKKPLKTNCFFKDDYPKSKIIFGKEVLRDDGFDIDGLFDWNTIKDIEIDFEKKIKERERYNKLSDGVAISNFMQKYKSYKKFKDLYDMFKTLLNENFLYDMFNSGKYKQCRDLMIYVEDCLYCLHLLKEYYEGYELKFIYEEYMKKIIL